MAEASKNATYLSAVSLTGKIKYHVEFPFNNLEQIVSLHEFR